MTTLLMWGSSGLALLALTACTGSNPVAPPPTPACQLNNTAILVIQVNDPQKEAEGVDVDGVNEGTVPFGSTVTLTVAAGEIHHVTWYNGVSLIQCELHLISDLLCGPWYATVIPSPCSSTTVLNPI